MVLLGARHLPWTSHRCMMGVIQAVTGGLRSHSQGASAGRGQAAEQLASMRLCLLQPHKLHTWHAGQSIRLSSSLKQVPWLFVCWGGVGWGGRKPVSEGSAAPAEEEVGADGTDVLQAQ